MALKIGLAATLVAAVLFAAVTITGRVAFANETVHKATPESLNGILKQAKGGDVVVLAPGEYTAIGLSKRTFEKPLVIEAGTATITGFGMSIVDGVEIRGGDFRVPPPTAKPSTGRLVYGAALRFDNARNIRLSKLTIAGPGAPPGVVDGPYGEGNGVQVAGGSNIEIADGRFVGLKNGITMGKVDGFRLTGNTFSAMRSDGMSLGEVRNGVIEGNDCQDTRMRDVEHPDCIQLWSRPTSPPTADIVIRNNRAHGKTQGILMGNHTRDGVDDGGFDRILVENNDLTVGFPNAIALVDGRSSIVRNNRIATLPGSQYPVQINTRGDVKLCGNVVISGGGKPGKVDAKC